MANQKPLSFPLGPARHRQLLRDFVAPGPGGPLLLLWSLGVGLFLVLGQAVFALVWTGVVTTLGLWMMYSYRGNPEVWEQFLRTSLAEQVPWKTLSDQSLRETIERSANVLVETALKPYGLEGSRQAQVELSRVLAAASELFSVQVELARNVDGLLQGLVFVSPDEQIGAELITEAPTSRQETVDAVQSQIDQARTLLLEIGQQLETLLLRVFQLETLSDICDGAAELAREMETILARVQAKVDSLHQAAPLLDLRHIPPDLRPLRDALHRGFSRSRSTQGLRALQQLESEYRQLQPVLEHRKGTDSLSVAQVPPLAEETYRQGLGVLKDALGLLQSVQSSDRDRLEAEMAELTEEINVLRAEQCQGERLRMKEETLASHQERLDLIDQQESHVEGLLHQCGRCEASLGVERRLSDGGLFSPEEAADIGMQVCDALEALHSADPPVLHRDLNPGNIRLAEGGRVVVTDFGVARTEGLPPAYVDREGPIFHRGVGAPEQWAGEEADVRTDIFQLGALLLVMLTGKYPNQGGVRLLENRQDVPRALTETVLRCLRESRSERFQAVADLKGGLKNAFSSPINLQKAWEFTLKSPTWLTRNASAWETPEGCYVWDRYTLHRLDRATGSLVWSWTVSQDGPRSTIHDGLQNQAVQVRGQLIYVRHGDYLSCLHSSSGATEWQHQHWSDVTGSFLLTNGFIVLDSYRTPGRKLLGPAALMAETGALVWHQEEPYYHVAGMTATNTALVLVERRGLAGRGGSRLRLVHLESGETTAVHDLFKPDGTGSEASSDYVSRLC